MSVISEAGACSERAFVVVFVVGIVVNLVLAISVNRPSARRLGPRLLTLVHVGLPYRPGAAGVESLDDCGVRPGEFPQSRGDVAHRIG